MLNLYEAKTIGEEKVTAVTLKNPTFARGYTISDDVLHELDTRTEAIWNFSGYLKHGIQKFIKGGTCEGQVLALARACLESDYPLTIGFLTQSLESQQEDILLLHAQQALDNLDIPAHCRPKLEPPYKLLDKKGQGAHAGSSKPVLYSQLSDKLPTLQAIGAVFMTALFSAHTIFLYALSDDSLISYDPNTATFRQGPTSKVLQATFNDYLKKDEQLLLTLRSFVLYDATNEPTLEQQKENIAALLGNRKNRS